MKANSGALGKKRTHLVAAATGVPVKSAEDISPKSPAIRLSEARNPGQKRRLRAAAAPKKAVSPRHRLARATAPEGLNRGLKTRNIRMVT